MQLTLREAAGYLGVSEATARRWIAQRALPVHRVNERLYLNAVELWEWAVENGVSVSRSLLAHARREPEDIASLAALLRAGVVVREVRGADKRQLL